jgi:iron complex outermembrane receptor protein
LALLVPGLQVGQSGVNALMYIRGIGSNNYYNGSDPSVTVQVDGVYFSRPYAQFTDFLDVARIEVLRGPQGTVYGRNAVGGTVNIISRDPSDTPSGEERVIFGNYGAFQEQAYLTGPIAPDVLQGSIAINYKKHDSYQTNIDPAGNDPNDEDEGGVRIQLRAEPLTGLVSSTRLDYSVNGSRPNAQTVLLTPFNASTNSILGNYGKVDLNTPFYGRVGAGGGEEDISYALNDAFTARSITAYRRNSVAYQADADVTPLNLAQINLNEDDAQFSEELNISGSHGRLSGVAGAYYFHENTDSEFRVGAFVPGTIRHFLPVTHTQSVAGFTQLNYAILDSLSATIGVRYTSERKVFDQDYGIYKLVGDAPGAPLPGQPSIFSETGHYDAVTPKYGLNYTVTPDLFLYFSASKGFKSGGFNAAAAGPMFSAFAPETLWSYEIGEKSQWFDNTFRFNVSAFKYDYSNLQVQTVTSPGVSNITNAAVAHLSGVEIEALWHPVAWLNVGADGAQLRAIYSSYPNASFAGGLTGNATGNTLTNAPRYSSNVFVELFQSGPSSAGISFRTDLAYRTRVYFDPSNALGLSQGPYALVNVNLKWRSPAKAWEVGVFGKNLADRQYVTYIASSARPYEGTPGDPRTFGISLARLW